MSSVYSVRAEPTGTTATGIHKCKRPEEIFNELLAGDCRYHGGGPSIRCESCVREAIDLAYRRGFCRGRSLR